MQPQASSSFHFRPATPADLAEVLTWIPDAAALRLWTGPKPEFPVTAEVLWPIIAGEPDTAYALTLSEGGLAGFGQVLPKDGQWLHLARIIISPAHRRQGAGRALCRKLMRIGQQNHPQTEAFTLNVSTENLPAQALYREIGFHEYNREPGLIRMLAPLFAVDQE